MTRTLTILTLFLTLLTSVTLGQIPKIKKVTEIRYEYSFGGRATTDTLKREYSLDGNTINSFVKQSVTYRTKTETIDSTKNRIHRKEYFSDSTFQDIFQDDYKDSIVAYCIQNQDTIYKIFNELRGKRKLKEISLDFRENYSPYCKTVNFDKQNLFTYNTTVITNYYKNGLTDTIKYCYNKLNKTKIEYSFNSFRKEWFKKKKEKFNSKGQLKTSVDQFYHDYHKMYFKTRTKYQYNDLGTLVLEVTYDPYLKMTVKKIVYQYEYY